MLVLSSFVDKVKPGARFLNTVVFMSNLAGTVAQGMMQPRAFAVERRGNLHDIIAGGRRETYHSTLASIFAELSCS